MPIDIKEKEVILPPVDLSLRSEAMHELISRKQGFLSRWALLIFLLILLLIGVATWFIHYPDVITTRATIIAANVPKEILTRQEGRLVKLYVRNGDNVLAGKILGFVESNANHQQVLQLDHNLYSVIKDLHDSNTLNISGYFESGFDSLGELQQGYQQFTTALQQFEDYIGGGYYEKKKHVLFGDLAFLQKNKTIIQQQKELIEKDLKLAEETYSVNERLYKEKVIAKQEDRNEQSKLLGKQMTVPQINATLFANETQQREKQKEIADLNHTISQQKILFRQQVQTLQSLIQDWIKKYILIAPIDGRVSFILPLQEGGYFPANRLLGYVNPAVEGYYAVATLPQNNFGKVENGQRVQLRIDAYPYNEFGFVNGQLNYITDFATDSGFLAHIKLPEGLLTNQHKVLRYRNGLKAEARIITKDMRLLDRLFYDLRKIVAND